MEFEGDFKKVKEETDRYAADGAGMSGPFSMGYSSSFDPRSPSRNVKTIPKLAALHSPSRKRKGKGKGKCKASLSLNASYYTFMSLLIDATNLRNELHKWRKEGDLAVAELRRRKEGLDLNSSEGIQFLQSIRMWRQNMTSVCDLLEVNFEEQKVNFIPFVENNRYYADQLLARIANKIQTKHKQDRQIPPTVELVVQHPRCDDMSSKGLVVDGGSESSSLADDEDKVEAMDMYTSGMEEQAPGMVSGVTLEMEKEMLAPDTNDDVENLGLNISMFDSPADSTATNKITAELDEMDRGKSSIQLADEATEIAAEEKQFTDYTSLWKSGRGSYGCGSFRDMTALSSMQLAHLIPGGGPSDYGQVCTTLQVYSIKLSEIKGGLQWPLHVYGVVAVRDAVDHNRNLLFARDKGACQIVKADDPYLCLIGPSRAIVLNDPIVIEIQLKLGHSQMSRDRSLISATRRYSVGSGTISFENCFCTTELRAEAIGHSVQATVLGVCVKEGPWPSEFGGIVYCLAPPLGQTCQEDQRVVLLDSRRRRMPTGLDGYLHLSRHVVSVELKSSLNFVLRTYSSQSSSNMGEHATMCFEPKYSGTSQETCYLGDTEVEITVAWSRLVVEKRNIALQGWVLED